MHFVINKTDVVCNSYHDIFEQRDIKNWFRRACNTQSRNTRRCIRRIWRMLFINATGRRVSHFSRLNIATLSMSKHSYRCVTVLYHVSKSNAEITVVSIFLSESFSMTVENVCPIVKYLSWITKVIVREENDTFTGINVLASSQFTWKNPSDNNDDNKLGWRSLEFRQHTS